jgi:U3 small nucleolar RNA-associated protein 4
LRIQKLSLPDSDGGPISSGRKLAFSPDGLWLIIITNENGIHLVSVQSNDGFDIWNPTKIRLEKPIRASERDADETFFSISGSVIRHVSFSSDSRLLAICDNDGYVSIWTLGSISSSTPQKRVRMSRSNAAEAERNQSLNLDDWRLHEVSYTFPRISPPPLVFSFQPTAFSDATQSTVIEKIFILTSDHRVLEFEALNGTLSTWGRQNFNQLLPGLVSSIRDRAKGYFWDVGDEKRRIWLYGNSWLFMLDLDQDFSLDESESASLAISALKKRKRSHGEAGAYETVHDFQKPRSVGSGIGLISIRQILGSSEPMDIDSNERSSIHSLKHAQHDAQETSASAQNAITRVDADDEATVEHESPHISTQDQKSNWMSREYRHILGILPLQSSDSTMNGSNITSSRSSDSDNTLEVVIVERPPWDFDLPARAYGDHEWAK